MKIVLIKDVKNVGKAGEVVNVSEGYGRNFLIPRKLAILGDAGAMKNVIAKKKSDEKREATLLAAANEIASKLQGITLKIDAKVGTGNKLYGSVTTQEIADELKKKHNIKIDKRSIVLSDPIKTLGEYDLNVKLHNKVTAKLHVSVEG